MLARIDHLVVAAASLDEGVAWCEATLGVTPGPGGEHPLMGTHNRLLRIATVDYPRAYLEIIAPQAGRAPQDGRRRWFDLDEPSVRESLAAHGPRLLHFVASVPDLRAALAQVAAMDVDRGEAVAATRMSPRGLLSWQISLRPDGQRLMQGVLPTLIQWGEVHPASAMPESGVTLQALMLSHPRAQALRSLFAALDLQGVTVNEGAPNVCALLHTPKGRVKLASEGL
jgi:hypothetical protein